MLRLRARLANLLLAAAKLAIGKVPADEVDEELPLPAGHPPVALSPVARAMVEAGAEKRTSKTRAPVGPLEGSLEQRFGGG